MYKDNKITGAGRGRRAAMTVVMALMLVALLPALSLAAAVGVFTQVEGRVDLLREGAHATVTVRTGTTVAIGDIVRTKSDGRAEIVFKDDTVLNIAPGSRIKIEEYSFNPDGSREQGLISLMRGKVRSVVSKVKAKVVPAAVGTSTYKVRTPTTVMGVKGTDVFVSYRRGISEVVFREGSGFVYNPGLPGDEVHLVAGQATIVTGSGSVPMSPRHVSEFELATHLKDTSGSFANGRHDHDEEIDKKHDDDRGERHTRVDKKGDDDNEDAKRSGGHDKDRVYSYSDDDDDHHHHDADWLSDSELSEHFASADDFDKDDYYDDEHSHGYYYGSSDDDDDLLPYTEADSSGLDNTPPVIVFDTNPDRLDDNGSPFIDMDASESVVYEYKVDGGSWLPLGGDHFTLSGISEGRHTVEVRATDGAGNATTRSYSWYYSPGLAKVSFSDSGNTTMTLDGAAMGAAAGRPISLDGEFNDLVPADQVGGWYTETSGSYAGIATPGAANMKVVFNDGSVIVGYGSNGQQWSAGSITGTVVGYGADHSTGTTWISAGETFGTFDPATETWSAVDIGTIVGTTGLIAMLDSGAPAPNALIPFAEVGRASLTGTDGNLSVNMRDVRFLAYSTGGAPQVWATGSVSGTYGVDPTAGDVVQVTGSGITADFAAVNWQGGNWLSTVSGGGTFAGTGSTLDGTAVSIDGAAAGSYGGGTFTGTGAGTVN